MSRSKFKVAKVSIAYALYAISVWGSVIATMLRREPVDFIVTSIFVVATVATGFAYLVPRYLWDQPRWMGAMISLGLSIAITAATICVAGPLTVFLTTLWIDGQSSVTNPVINWIEPILLMSALTFLAVFTTKVLIIWIIGAGLIWALLRGDQKAKCRSVVR